MDDCRNAFSIALTIVNFTCIDAIGIGFDSSGAWAVWHDNVHWLNRAHSVDFSALLKLL
jgi:hypothetical protein